MSYNLELTPFHWCGFDKDSHSPCIEEFHVHQRVVSQALLLPYVPAAVSAIFMVVRHVMVTIWEMSRQDGCSPVDPVYNHNKILVVKC